MLRRFIHKMNAWILQYPITKGILLGDKCSFILNVRNTYVLVDRCSMCLMYMQV